MTRMLLAATALTLVGATSAGLDIAQAAPTTFFGEDGNTTGGTPIPHPISDATQAAFLANLTNPGTETFDSFSNGQTNVSPVFGNGITANLSGGIIQNFSSGGRFAISSPNYYNTDTSSFAINFSGPVAAFGFYGTDVGDFGGVLSLTLTDIHGVKSTLIVPAIQGSGGSQPANGSVLYYGFYDTGDKYTSISFNNSNTIDDFGFDNFTVGTVKQVKPVPEPDTLLLVGCGLLGLAALRRRGGNAI